VDEDSDSSSDEEYGGPSVRTRRWAAHEITKFKEVLGRLAHSDGPSWDAVAREFPGRTPEQCQSCYRKLRESREITFVLKPPKSPEAMLRKKVKAIVGVEFLGV
jgi:hypothetical protein